jgi:hypothetical protein
VQYPIDLSISHQSQLLSLHVMYMELAVSQSIQLLQLGLCVSLFCILCISACFNISEMQCVSVSLQQQFHSLNLW